MHLNLHEMDFIILKKTFIYIYAIYKNNSSEDLKIFFKYSCVKYFVKLSTVFGVKNKCS